MDRTGKTFNASAFSAGLGRSLLFLPALRNRSIKLDDDDYIYNNSFIGRFSKSRGMRGRHNMVSRGFFVTALLSRLPVEQSIG